MKRFQSGRPGAGRISVIIPTLEEEASLPGVLAGLSRQADGPALEVILADGGSRDRTVASFLDLTRGWAARGWSVRHLACSRRGRAAQMNEAARLATGDVLLFLHADTVLPPGGLAAVDRLLRRPGVVGGGFRLRFEGAGALLRLIGGWATARSRLLRIHHGDQAMFVRRGIFEASGGFPDVPLFEDLRFARALRSRGRVRTVPLAVLTSARRLRSGGIARAAARFAWLRLRHGLGVDPAHLKTDYPDVR